MAPWISTHLEGQTWRSLLAYSVCLSILSTRTLCLLGILKKLCTLSIMPISILISVTQHFQLSNSNYVMHNERIKLCGYIADMWIGHYYTLRSLMRHRHNLVHVNMINRCHNYLRCLIFSRINFLTRLHRNKL